MAKQGKKIKLILRGDSDKFRMFDFDHAESLLKMQHTMGRNDWDLSTGSKYELKNGKLTPRTNPRPVSKTQEQRAD